MHVHQELCILGSTHAQVAHSQHLTHLLPLVLVLLVLLVIIVQRELTQNYHAQEATIVMQIQRISY